MKHLVAEGFEAASIHGNKSQGQRDRALKEFKSGKTSILVATDVAARGIDIPGVSHVYNYNLPEVAEAYVHRIGRTARAGRGGEAVAFCAPDEKPLLRQIQKLLNMDIDVAGGDPSARMGLDDEPAAPPQRGRGGRGSGGGGGGAVVRQHGPVPNLPATAPRSAAPREPARAQVVPPASPVPLRELALPMLAVAPVVGAPNPAAVLVAGPVLTAPVANRGAASRANDPRAALPPPIRPLPEAAHAGQHAGRVRSRLTFFPPLSSSLDVWMTEFGGAQCCSSWCSHYSHDSGNPFPYCWTEAVSMRRMLLSPSSRCRHPPVGLEDNGVWGGWLYEIRSCGNDHRLKATSAGGARSVAQPHGSRERHKQSVFAGLGLQR